MKRERIERVARGRPRSEAAHAAILAAALEVARSVGYDALTIEAVAARAGVGKATVYRRWASKELLVAEAVERIVRTAPVPDLGSVRRDLAALLDEVVQMYADPQGAAMLSSLVAAMARSEPIARAVREGFVGARRGAVREVLQRGVGRGELRRSTDLELAADMFSGTLMYRYLVAGADVEATYRRRLIDALLRGFAPTRR